jgi:hypothetical protein
LTERPSRLLRSCSSSIIASGMRKVVLTFILPFITAGLSCVNRTPQPPVPHPGRFGTDVRRRGASFIISRACPKGHRLAERFSPGGTGYPSRLTCGHCFAPGLAGLERRTPRL